MKFPKLGDPWLAEFVGMLLGDGQISSNFVGITINGEDDKDYVLYILTLIKDLFNLNVKVRTRKNDKTVDIDIREKDVVNYLLAIGMVKSPKWNRAEIPIFCLNSELGK